MFIIVMDITSSQIVTQRENKRKYHKNSFFFVVEWYKYEKENSKTVWERNLLYLIITEYPKKYQILFKVKVFLK